MTPPGLSTPLVAFGPAGDLLASYRKTYLYDSFGYRESDRLTAGDGAPVTIKTGDLTLGLMTCYDLRFPEFARLLVEAAPTFSWCRPPGSVDR